jgi:hypothetical protein
MSRDHTVEEDRPERTTTSGDVQGGRGGAHPQGYAAVCRIDETENFWSHLHGFANTHNASGIENLFFSENQAGRLDRHVRYASRPQMSILYDALRTLHPGDHPRQIDDALWTIFAALPDQWPGMKYLCFAIRFRVSVVDRNVTNDNEVRWDAPTLRRVWGILSRLPPQHVEGNQAFDHLIHYQNGKTPGGSGGYYSSKEIAAVTYNPDTIATERQTGSSQVNRGDPLANVNRFDKVVRHEVGHAVDAQLHISSTYGRTPAGGGWETLDLAHTVREIVHHHAAVFTHPDQAAAALTARLQTLGEHTTPAALHAALPHMAHGNANIEDILKLLTALMTNKNAGYSAQPIVQAGGKAYQQVGSQYFAYNAEARARQVSNYQFKTPMEWVAEAYAAYYEPDPRGKGAKLADRDHATKHWFDQHVDRPNEGRGSAG